MASYTRICVICNSPFEATSARAKYCSDECRILGAQAARREWENRSNYREKERLRMKEYRAGVRRDRQRQADAAQVVRREEKQQEYAKRCAAELAEMRKKAAAGDLEAQQFIAEQKGDWLEYWRLERELYLRDERESGKQYYRIVGGIDIHDEDFVERLAELLLLEEEEAEE